jgi:4-diphosphocytidyl-2-C-methyl-D-erythritol kinase
LSQPSGAPSRLNVRAAAKINLALLVGPTREGRFHEVVTIMQAVGLWDEMEVLLTAEGLGLEVEGEALPPDESNLVLVAARELARRSRDLPGARFRLRKGIPVASGLGGGSADGAAALLALDRLWGLRLPAVNLFTMAAEVGSDVPFCLNGGSRLATGRGDRMTEIPVKGSFWWVIGIDAQKLATASVYQRFDELGLARSLDGRWPGELLAALARQRPRGGGVRAAAVLGDQQAAAARGRRARRRDERQRPDAARPVPRRGARRQGRPRGPPGVRAGRDRPQPGAGGHVRVSVPRDRLETDIEGSIRCQQHLWAVV